MSATIRSKMLKFLVVFFVLFYYVSSPYAQEHTHGDSGHHSHDSDPHFKYSKEANQPEDADDREPVHDHQHGGHGHSHDESPSSKSQRDTGRWLWLNAIGSTALISAAPWFILLVIPLENTKEHEPFLKVLLSFASGGLLGDAFLHLIPHAISPHSHGGEDGHAHDHGHSHGASDSHDHSHEMNVGLWVLAGIVVFLMVEKTVRHIKGGEGHGHSHGVVNVSTSSDKSTKSDNQQQKKKGNNKGNKNKKEASKKKGSLADIKVAGLLNLAADFTHNFTDGLAIGASYLVSRNVGIVTTITILLHEVPHEIGDFAILIQSGCSKRKAMLLQLTTAVGAMLGTLCSLFAEGVGDAAVAWILPFTAGGFIYIATVSIIPELLENCKLWQSIKEIFGLFIGVFMMVLIAKYE